MGASRSIIASATDLVNNHEPDPLQRLLQEVGRDQVDWRRVAALVADRVSKKHQLHYRCTIELRRLYRIEPSEIVQGYLQEAEASQLGAPTPLFHGTTPQSAERIVLTGFEIPHKGGMFGRGIYFAKDPLKSIGYAREGYRAGEEPGLLAYLWPSLFAKREARMVRHMLLCDVYLGRSRTLRKARPNFRPDKQLRRSRLLRCAGAEPYNSVRAPGGVLGAVRVTEFVVYSPHQAIPRFLIEFEPAQLTERARV